MLLNLFETGEKMIVFSQYPTKTLKLIERQLETFRPLLYHGALTQRAREIILQQFKENEKVKVLLISLRAGGLGLTLTSANYVTHFDSWWNPAVMLQAEDRTHRIGQTQNVVVTSLITKNTVEERIQQILEEKQKLFQEVVGDISQYQLTNVLTEQELFALFGLQKEKRKKSL
jgi:non-specific serine/threonine protein kinase